jgi:vacuolar-type H+-ATPase subunit H
MRRKDRPTSPPSPASSTAERLAAIVEAAERAAVTVIDDAEEQARKRLEEARAEADRLVAERLAAIADLTDSLVAQAEEVRARSERLVSSLEEARRHLDGDSGPGSPQPRSRPSHLTAVDTVTEAAAEAAPEPQSGPGRGERGTPAGARLLATQMAVSGNSREEIETRLRNGFEIEDTAAILDAILGPED